MIENFTVLVVVLLTDIVSLFIFTGRTQDDLVLLDETSSRSLRYQVREKKACSFLFANAKGVAGLGKAGGDGTGGSDKAGQQVPPEVYNALTYAGSAFLLTLSVPIILYCLNKLLNKIEDCFGCGPSSREKKNKRAMLEHQFQTQQLIAHSKKQAQQQSPISIINGNISVSPLLTQPTIGQPDATAITHPFCLPEQKHQNRSTHSNLESQEAIQAR